MVEAIYYFPAGSVGPEEDRHSYWPDGEVFASEEEALRAIRDRYGDHGTYRDSGCTCVHESDSELCGGWILAPVERAAEIRRQMRGF